MVPYLLCSNKTGQHDSPIVLAQTLGTAALFATDTAFTNSDLNMFSYGLLASY